MFSSKVVKYEEVEEVDVAVVVVGVKDFDEVCAAFDDDVVVDDEVVDVVVVVVVVVDNDVAVVNLVGVVGKDFFCREVSKLS